MFEMQRQSIEQGRRWFQRSVNAQARLPQALRNAIKSGLSIQRSSVGATRNVWKASLEAYRASAPGRTEDAFENLERAVDEQFDALDRINERAWRTAEDGVVDNAEAYARFLDQSASLVDAPASAYADSLGAVARRVREGTRETAQSAERAGTETGTDRDEGIDEAEGDDLRSIPGIGSAYAERLRAEGVDGVAALAEVDASSCAERIGVSEKRVSLWVDEARDRVDSA